MAFPPGRDGHFLVFRQHIGLNSGFKVSNSDQMICEIYVEVILANEEMADAVWLFWINDVISQKLALALWKAIASSDSI